MTSVEQRKQNGLLTRRDFLILAGVTATSGLLGLNIGYYRIMTPMREQSETWKKVLSVDQDTFLEEYKAKLSVMRIGANICPDYRLLAENVDADAAISLLTKKFGIQDVRLGIWWSTYDTLGIAPYLPWFEACKKNNIKVTTCLPSPKGPRAPEQQEPDKLRERLKKTNEFPEVRSIITSHSKFGQEALKAARNFFEDMKINNLNLEDYDYCPVNEIYDANGNWKFRMSEELMYGYCKLISEYAPSSTVLFNTTGIALEYPSPLEQCVTYAINIKAKLPSLKFKIGTDFYHQTRPGKINENIFIDTLSGSRMIYGKQHIEKQKKRMKEHGILDEVTEAQEEAWDRAYDYGPPRYKPETEEHLRYILARIANELIENNRKDPFIVRLWGVENDLIEMLHNEKFANTNTSFALIRRINEMSQNHVN